MNRVLVTSYLDPDLDGTACAFAYAEFLTKTGIPAVACIFGSLHREAQFVVDKFNINGFEDGTKLINLKSKVILGDASDLKGISKLIKPEQVIEVIDHRKVHEAHLFPNAKVQIELVGSAATLIAEKFKQQNVPISRESAALLYSAVISNTINFKAGVTTERDVKIAQWLNDSLKLDGKYVEEMFEYKSKIVGSLKTTVEHDFALFEFNRVKLGIAQLEIVNVDNFVLQNEKELLNIIKSLEEENKLNLVFATLIDVKKATNTFVAPSKKMQELLVKCFQVKFNEFIAKREGILMRKQLTPLLKKEIEQQNM